MGNTCSETWVTHLTLDCSARELRDALVGGVGNGPAFGVCDVGASTGCECRGVVPPFRHQPQDGLQVAAPCRVPEPLPPIEYAPEHQVRRVQHGGWISFKGKAFKLPKAFAGYPVGLLPTTRDGIWNVIFASRHIAQLDRRQGTTKTVTHVSEHL